jgi:hypothetical protein
MLGLTAAGHIEEKKRQARGANINILKEDLIDSLQTLQG